MNLGPVTVEALEMELVAYTYNEGGEEEAQEEQDIAQPAQDEVAQGPEAAASPEATSGLDYDAEAPAAADENSNSTKNNTKPPIHIAGFISGYIVVNLTSDLGHPALTGLTPAQLGLAEGESELTAKATFSFDSRTGTFSVSAEIRYEDDYVLIVAQAAASTNCGEGDVQSIMVRFYRNTRTATATFFFFFPFSLLQD